MSDATRDLLARGIGAVKAGDKDQARFFLEWALRTDADTEHRIQAWLWLSEVCDGPAEKRECLENILAHDPYHPLARRGLAILNGRLNPADVIDPNRPLPPTPDSGQQPLHARRFVCPDCGGKLTSDADGQTLTCAYCQRQQTLYRAIEEGAMIEEEDFAVALATAKGHSQPSATRAFQCQACGVSFMLRPGVLSLVCPYCTSVYVVNLAETRQLISPQAIIPFSISQTRATTALQTWLEEENRPWSIGSLVGLYLPAWSFDLGGTAGWRAQATDGATGIPAQRPQSGSYPIFYEDIVVPASHTLPPQLAEELQHYDLKGLVPFQTGYLADWPAETYQISAADASLVARHRAWERLQVELGVRLDLELRAAGEVSFSSAGMVVEAFKLVLLPIWIAHYQGHAGEETAVVNGQTGRVRAKRQRSGLTGWLSKLLGVE